MRLKQRIESLMYVPKHARPAEVNIYRMLLPSIMGIVVCMVCLAGATWAWFTASVTTSPQRITAANYDMTVSITNGGVEIPAENGTYTLRDGVNTVKLTATGNASTGYCKIVIGDKTYYTPQFPNPKDQNPVTEFIFKVTVSGSTKMTVIPVWGTYAGEDVLGGTQLDLTVPQSGGQSQANDIIPSENTTPQPEETTSTVPSEDNNSQTNESEPSSVQVPAGENSYNKADTSDSIEQ